MTLAELPAYLEALAVRAGYAAIPGADAIGSVFRDEVKKRLTALSHERPTRTPAPPGGPPAMESGGLAASVTMDPASTPVVATAVVGPHAPPKDYVQEYGMTIHAKSRGGMRFQYGSDFYRARVVRVPEREYMLSSAEIVAHDGSAATEAAGAFYAAMWG